MTFKYLKYIPIFAVCHIGLSYNAMAEEIGINALVKGSVTIKGVEDTAAKPALVKQPVSLGDEVSSKADSSLQILLKDKTVFTVGAQADLTIDEFVYDPRANSNKITASVKRGMFRYMSGNAAKTNPDNITIETPTASMGIRGTVFEAIVGPEALVCAEKEGVLSQAINVDYDGATLIVLRGPGGESNTNNRQGEIVVTAGGQSVTLSQSGSATLVSNDYTAPSRVFQISNELYNFFNRKLRSEPSGDENYAPFDPDPRLIRPEIIIEDETGFIPFNPVEDMDLPRRTTSEEFDVEDDIDIPDTVDDGVDDGVEDVDDSFDDNGNSSDVITDTGSDSLLDSDNANSDA